MTGAAGGRLAVVDLGSNSVRLFLCRGIGPQGPEGERRSTVTALRRGAAADGAVAPDALARLDECLAAYAASIDEFGPGRTVVVATSAVRDAPNADAVASVVAGRLGVPMRVLSGQEEAAVSFAGARLAVDGDGAVTVVDVGGGSTELVRGTAAGPAAAVSLQLGAVRHTERHLRSDPPAPAELSGLRRDALAMIGPALEGIGGAAPAVGVAGTITSLAAIEIGAYDRDRVHRHRLTRDGVEDLVALLAAMTVEQRRHVPGLDPARAGVIVAGALIVASLMEAGGLDSLMVSETDLLDGVALAVIRPPGEIVPVVTSFP